MDNFKHPLIWFIPIIALIVSFSPVPFGFYTLIRLIVTVAAVYLAYLDYKINEKNTAFLVIFVLIALFFNPIIKIHFSRFYWHFIDVIVLVILIVHYVKIKKNILHNGE